MERSTIERYGETPQYIIKNCCRKYRLYDDDKQYY